MGSGTGPPKAGDGRSNVGPALHCPACGAALVVEFGELRWFEVHRVVECDACGASVLLDEGDSRLPAGTWPRR